MVPVGGTTPSICGKEDPFPSSVHFMERRHTFHNQSVLAMAHPHDIQLHIPRSVADAITLPEGRKEEELRRELAITLYREGMLSFGKARELADLDKFAFAQLLGTRGIERHYGAEELDEDLTYARDEDKRE